jgi:hypothetical protein
MPIRESRLANIMYLPLLSHNGSPYANNSSAHPVDMSIQHIQNFGFKFAIFISN